MFQRVEDRASSIQPVNEGHFGVAVFRGDAPRHQLGWNRGNYLSSLILGLEAKDFFMGNSSYLFVY